MLVQLNLRKQLRQRHPEGPSYLFGNHDGDGLLPPLDDSNTPGTENKRPLKYRDRCTFSLPSPRREVLVVTVLYDHQQQRSLVITRRVGLKLLSIGDTHRGVTLDARRRSTAVSQ